ncbi:MAG: hypothetical protein IPM51_02805 [Sphingobacteriaceae bacterium]|nr:hypothetical protein [Sphingobacteriaceae bacterium]
MKKRKYFLLLSILVFGVLGYFRERFFEHLNIILASVYRGTNEYEIVHQEMPQILAPLMSWSYINLYYSKYAFTLGWTFIFYACSYVSLKLLLTEAGLLLKYLTRAYLLILILAAISMIFGYFINGNLKNDEYTFSRWLLGIGQSPIICLILLASEKLNLKSISHD